MLFSFFLDYSHLGTTDWTFDHTFSHTTSFQDISATAVYTKIAIYDHFFLPSLLSFSLKKNYYKL